MLIPYGFSGQIPFVSLGGEVGRRVQVHCGSSPVSGAFVVEDVAVDGDTHRRLVFLDNQFLVQSEARLKTVKRKNKTKQVVDFGHLSLYHTFMCVGVQMCRIPPQSHVAVLGLGGGSLCMFLRKCYDDLKVTAVDLDPAMLEVAKGYFDLKTDERMLVQIKDGLDFLKDEAECGNVYSAVMFDMDSKDPTLGLSCPPKQFLQHHVLQHLNNILADTGHFILNLVCRDTELQSSIMDTLKRHFKHIVSVKLFEEVNEVIFATNGNGYTVDDLENSAKNLNTIARQKGLVDVKCVDLKDFLQSLNIIS